MSLAPDAQPDSVAIASSLKVAMRHMPSPVALISSTDAATGKPAGLAATAFVPVAMEPPSMLVCVNLGGSAHAVIESTGAFCINVIGLEQADELLPFAIPDRRDERFQGAAWQERHGLPFLEGAAANIFCRTARRDIFGTHEIFLGEVFDVIVNTDAAPALWHKGKVVELPIA